MNIKEIEEKEVKRRKEKHERKEFWDNISLMWDNISPMDLESLYPIILHNNFITFLNECHNLDIDKILIIIRIIIRFIAGKDDFVINFDSRQSMSYLNRSQTHFYRDLNYKLNYLLTEYFPHNCVDCKRMIFFRDAFVHANREFSLEEFVKIWMADRCLKNKFNANVKVSFYCCDCYKKHNIEGLL